VERAAELRELANSWDVPADMATRARIVLWSAEGRRRKDIAELLGVSLPTVDRWKARYAQRGLAGLEGDRPGGSREQVPAWVRARVIALTRMTPPAGTGLSHWSTRELARYLQRTENVVVSWHYIARVWREENLKPYRSGNLQDFEGPRVRGQGRRCRRPLPRSLPGGAVVLSIDREDADPGAGPDAAGAARHLRGHRETHPRLRPARHHEPVRRHSTSQTGEVIGEWQAEPERQELPGLCEEGGETATPGRTSTSSWTTSPPTPQPR